MNERQVQLKHQLITFTLVGILAVLVDLICYYTLLNALPESPLAHISNEALAKSISFICGMTVTYSLNKIFTWKKKDRSQARLLKFGLLYATSLILNVSINSIMLTVLKNQIFAQVPFKYLIAFVCATGTSACFNFIGQKFWVFKS